MKAVETTRWLTHVLTILHSPAFPQIYVFLLRTDQPGAPEDSARVDIIP